MPRHLPFYHTIAEVFLLLIVYNISYNKILMLVLKQYIVIYCKQ